MSAYSTTTEETETESDYEEEDNDEYETEDYAYNSIATEFEGSCHTPDAFASNKYEPMMEIRNEYEYNYYSSEDDDDDDDDGDDDEDCKSLMSLSPTEISPNSDFEFEDFGFNNDQHTDDYHLISFSKHNTESMDVMMDDLEEMNKWINILNSINKLTNSTKKMNKNLLIEIARYSANEFRLKQENIDINNDLHNNTDIKVINNDNLFDKYPNGQLINVSIDGYSMHELRFKKQYIYNEINYLDRKQFHVIDVDHDYNDNNNTDDNDTSSPITDKYPVFDEMDISLIECCSEHRGKILSATTYITNNMWDLSEYEAIIIDLGLIARFIKLLESDSNKLIYNIASILDRILDEFPDNAICYKPAIPILCQLISCQSRRIKQYTLNIICSICKNVTLFRDDILENNILYSLQELIMNDHINPDKLSIDRRKLLRNIARVLLAICSKHLSQIFDTAYIDEKYVPETLTLCNILIQTEDEEIVENIFDIYKYLMDLNNDQHIFDGDIVFNGDEYIKMYNTKQKVLLLTGFIRDTSPDIKLPSDVEGTCLNFMETKQINDAFEMNLYRYFMNFIDGDKLSIYTDNVSNILSNGCNNITTRLESVTNIRQLLSMTTDPPIQSVVNTGVIPKLIEFLQCNDCTELQFEAAWTLTNIVSKELKHTKCVIDNGAIPIFINLLKSPSSKVCDQSIWALGNICGENVECRDLVLNDGILNNLLLLLSPDHSDNTFIERIDLFRNISWVFSNLSTGTPHPQWIFVKIMIKGLNILLHINDEEVLKSTISAYNQLFQDNEQQQQQQTVIPNLTDEQILCLQNKGCQVQQNEQRQWVVIPPSVRTMQLNQTTNQQQHSFGVPLPQLNQTMLIPQPYQTTTALYGNPVIMPLQTDNDTNTNDGNDVDKQRCFDDTHFNVILNEDDIDTMDRIINALQHESENVIGVALKCIGDIAVASDSMIKLLVNKGVLEKLKIIIANNHETQSQQQEESNNSTSSGNFGGNINVSTSMEKDAYWIISSITTINELIESIMDSNIYDLLINAMKNKCYDIAHEALWSISNTVLIKNDLQIKYLVNHGVISALCVFLEKYRWGRGNQIITVTMDTIESILNVGEKNKESDDNDDNKLSEYAKMFKYHHGLQYIKDIKQGSCSNELYQKTNNILQLYFNENNVIALVDDIDF